MKKYKHKMNKPTMLGIVEYTEKMVAQEAQNDDDRLLFATLISARKILKKKLLDVEAEYSNSKVWSLTFSPAEAIALRILYIDYIRGSKNYIAEQMHTMSNEIHQLFFTPTI